MGCRKSDIPSCKKAVLHPEYTSQVGDRALGPETGLPLLLQGSWMQAQQNVCRRRYTALLYVSNQHTFLTTTPEGMVST